ncbi:YqgE/AlgH family protein [Bartonella sp. DGB1]|uniref:YqgE/AlgH family protein n=1 Tax=Bartonella sp. DGB1 TaxID=3239807 RepID=UPI003524F3BD
MSQSGKKNKLIDQSYIGKILIATSVLDKGYFSRTIIYICSHNDTGALGLIVNKPSLLNLSDVMCSNKFANHSFYNLGYGKNYSKEAFDTPFLQGGPVEEKAFFTLHSVDSKFSNTISVTNNVCLTSHIDVYQAIASGNGPKEYINIIGYTAWYAGQLEQEIKANCWLIQEPELELLFSKDYDNKYNNAMKNMGIDPLHFIVNSGYA